MLGTVVANRWKRKDYDEECFPEIASEALREYPPSEHVSLWDVVKPSLLADRLPPQTDLEARFGDPPLTVFIGRGFRIEVLFWAEGTPSIHQHAFSGAFHVLEGSSVHALWDFTLQQRFELRLLLGQVSFKRAETLIRGDSRPIYGGQQMFHSTFHIDCPSVSVVVRTVSEADKHPQYTLWPPHVAFAPLDEVAAVKRQTQLLRMLLVTGKRSEFNEIMSHLLPSKDAYSAFCYLFHTFNLLREEEREELLVAARRRHTTLIDALEPTLKQKEVADAVLSMYRSVTGNSDLKFFLALLRNVPAIADMLKLIEERHPGVDPVVTVVTWMRRLSEVGMLHTEYHESWFLMLESLLRRRSQEHIHRAFAEHAGQRGWPRAGADVDQLAAQMRASWIFQCIQ